MIITTSLREYPNFGDDFNGHTMTGSAMRYMGAGYSLLSARWYSGRFASGVQVYFIC